MMIGPARVYITQQPLVSGNMEVHPSVIKALTEHLSHAFGGMLKAQLLL